MTQRTDLETAEDAQRLESVAAPSSAKGVLNLSNRGRRSVRIAVALPLEIRDQAGTRLQARTQFVMLRGAVLATNSSLRVGHKLTIQNLKSGKSAECHVVNVEPGTKEQHQVEIEFTYPEPDFWPVQFPVEEARSLDQYRVHLSGAGATESKLNIAGPTRVHDDGLVVLAGAVAENYSAAPTHAHEKFAAKAATVDSVAQFRAANRAAHRREQRIKAFYSLLSLAALAAAVAGGRSWLNRHPQGVEASTEPLIQSVSQKIAQALPNRTSKPTPTPATAEPQATGPSAADQPSTRRPVSKSNAIPVSESAAPNLATPSQPESQASQPQVVVRHGSSFAAARKIATEDPGEAPSAVPLQTTETASLQPRPEVLKSVVAETPVDNAVLAPQVPKRVVPAKLIHSVLAQYPSMARQLHVEGEVMLLLEVDASGNVSSVKVLSGPPLLRAAAMDAVKHWQYQPATLGDTPVSSTETVKVAFHWR
ncbi:MAG TPA: TonB family protein [Terriglobales bacterium]|nr:TonB family protein [Terriglobales bacterium]